MKFATSRFSIANRMTDHFRIDESVYPSALTQPRHTHLFASFSFVSAGNYLEKVGSKTYLRQPSVLVIHPAGESHSVEYKSRVQILGVQFSFEKLASLREQSFVLDSPISCRTPASERLATQLSHELRQSDAASSLAVEGLILEILAEAVRGAMTAPERKVPIWLNRAKEFLDDNLVMVFTLEDVAKIADVHPAHLSRTFREKFGCTIGEYLRRRRVEFAARQITTTDLPLSEIASNVGFSDQSHLNRVFKSFFAQTPYKYRKARRKR